jgi:hypothetical protein
MRVTPRATPVIGNEQRLQRDQALHRARTGTEAHRPRFRAMAVLCRGVSTSGLWVWDLPRFNPFKS